MEPNGRDFSLHLPVNEYLSRPLIPDSLPPPLAQTQIITFLWPLCYIHASLPINFSSLEITKGNMPVLINMNAFPTRVLLPR